MSGVSARMRSVSKLWLFGGVACCFLVSAIVQPIEVHEDVNEGPIGAQLHRSTNASAPEPPQIEAAVNERNVNDPPPTSSPTSPPPSPGEYRPEHQQGSEERPAERNANNFTTFPSNHKLHSGASAAAADGSSTPAAGVEPRVEGRVAPTPTSGLTSAALPPATRNPPGLSSFRATTVHSSRPASIVNGDRSAQHQISGYRKRQLYASAVLQRNASLGGQLHEVSSTEGQFAKEFIPSPEMVPFFGDGSSLPNGQPTTSGQGFVPTSGGGVVDASYPTGQADGGDSKWYAGFGVPPGRSYSTTGTPAGRPSSGDDPAGKWAHKLSWSTPQRQREQSFVHFPQESVPLFPSPKGKWKWISEEGGDSDETPVAGAARKPSATPFSSAGSFEEQPQPHSYFGKHYFTHPTVKNHPYSFDRTPGEGTGLSSGGSTFSSDAGSIPTTVASSTETSGEQGPSIAGSPADANNLSGKEDAHLKSVSPWKKIIHVLSAAIPIGLLISALTPQVVYINPNATQPPIQLQTPTPISGVGPTNAGQRQRSLGPEAARMLLAQRGLDADPAALVSLFHKLTALERNNAELWPPGAELDGSNRLSDGSGGLQGCDWKLLCQLTRQGMLPGSDALLKTLWKITNETRPDWTGPGVGLEEVFRIIRSGDCGQLQRNCGPSQDLGDAPS